MAEHGRIYFEPIIIKSNYHRCSRPVPAPADIPLVEYHSSGGGGDGQQVRFYCILLKITKYFKIPFKKILSYSRKGSEFYLGCFSGWFVRRTTRTIYWPLPPGQHPGPKVTFRPASTKQARYTIVRKKLEGSCTYNEGYGKKIWVLTDINFSSDIISRLQLKIPYKGFF